MGSHAVDDIDANSAHEKRVGMLEVAGIAFGTLLALVTLTQDEYSPLGIVIVLIACSLATLSLYLWVNVARRPKGRNPGSKESTVARKVRHGTWLLTAIVLVLTLTSAFSSKPVSLKAACVPAGSITSPANGDDVPSLVDVRGTASCIEGQSLWVLQRPRNNIFYTTSEVPLNLDGSGEWRLDQIGVGRKGSRDVNKAYRLYLVSIPNTDDAIQTRIQSELKGGLSVPFQKLPSQAVVLSSVRVQRGE
jgi:hypothetical protein